MKEFFANVFDTETTGLLKPGAVDVEQQPYITDIYVAKLLHKSDGTVEQVDEFETLIKVPVPITEEITRITGLTSEQLANSPEFVEIAHGLSEFFLGVKSMVAHNLAFDRSMLTNELFRCDRVLKFPWPMNHVCTVEKTMFIEQRRLSLARLHEELFDEGFPDAHRAKPDVLALVRCYIELVRREII